MLNEHAVTYKNKLEIEQLDYLIKKANRLGKDNRDIVHVYQQEDCDGMHVYFEVTGLRERKYER